MVRNTRTKDLEDCWIRINTVHLSSKSYDLESIDILRALTLSLLPQGGWSNLLINCKGDSWITYFYLLPFYLGEWPKCRRQVGKEAEVTWILRLLISSQMTESWLEIRCICGGRLALFLWVLISFILEKPPGPHLLSSHSHTANSPVSAAYSLSFSSLLWLWGSCFSQAELCTDKRAWALWLERLTKPTT